MTPVVRRILKHNMGFGNNPKMRLLVQDYFLALNSHNDGRQAVKDFVHKYAQPNLDRISRCNCLFCRSMHGGASTCPHPRVLPNLVSVSVSAVQYLFEDQTSTYDDKNEVLRCAQEFDSRYCTVWTFLIRVNKFSLFDASVSWSTVMCNLLLRLACFIGLFQEMSTFEDWRLSLAQLLQPIPFPAE